MKKVIAGICVAALMCSMTACGNSSKQSSSDGNVSLSWYVPLSKQTDMQSVMDEAAKITEPLIGAKIDMQPIDTSSYTERMNMLMASGATFDMAFTGYVNPYLQSVKRGGLLDITEYVENSPKLKEAIPDYAWDAAKIDGRLYAVPNTQGYAPPVSVYLRKALVEKYNLDVNTIEKMEDLEPFMAQVKAGESGVYIYRNNYGAEPWTGGIYEEISSGVAIRCDGSSPEVFFIDETPEYQQALSTMRDWYLKGYIREDVLSAGDDSQDVKMGKYVINQGGWLPGAEQTGAASHGGEIVIKPMMKPYLSKSKALATMIGIGKGSKNAEKSVQMIELLNTNVELFNLISFGIEGKHYTKNDEGKLIVNADAGYNPNCAWAFGNQFNAYLLEGQEDDIWEETEKMNNESITSPLIGFVLDTDPIKNEISQISSVTSEYPLTTFIVNGKEGNWDAYKEKLKTAGADRVLEEIQKQVNEYWATK